MEKETQFLSMAFPWERKVGAQVINLYFIYASPKSEKRLHLLGTLKPTSPRLSSIQTIDDDVERDRNQEIA